MTDADIPRAVVDIAIENGLTWSMTEPVRATALARAAAAWVRTFAAAKPTAATCPTP